MDRGYLQICHMQVEDRLPKDGPLKQNNKTSLEPFETLPGPKNQWIHNPLFFTYLFFILKQNNLNVQVSKEWIQVPHRNG